MLWHYVRLLLRELQVIDVADDCLIHPTIRQRGGEHVPPVRPVHLRRGAQGSRHAPSDRPAPPDARGPAR